MEKCARHFVIKTVNYYFLRLKIATRKLIFFSSPSASLHNKIFYSVDCIKAECQLRGCLGRWRQTSGSTRDKWWLVKNTKISEFSANTYFSLGHFLGWFEVRKLMRIVIWPPPSHIIIFLFTVNHIEGFASERKGNLIGWICDWVFRE